MLDVDKLISILREKADIAEEMGLETPAPDAKLYRLKSDCFHQIAEAVENAQIER